MGSIWQCLEMVLVVAIGVQVLLAPRGWAPGFCQACCDAQDSPCQPPAKELFRPIPVLRLRNSEIGYSCFLNVLNKLENKL